MRWSSTTSRKRWGLIATLLIVGIAAAVTIRGLPTERIHEHCEGCGRDHVVRRVWLVTVQDDWVETDASRWLTGLGVRCDSHPYRWNTSSSATGWFGRGGYIACGGWALTADLGGFAVRDPDAATELAGEYLRLLPLSRSDRRRFETEAMALYGRLVDQQRARVR